MNVEPDLFAVASENLEPLAARMRPQSLDEVVGQTHLLGGPAAAASDRSNTLHSFILWGPPGLVKPPLRDWCPSIAMRCSCSYQRFFRGKRHPIGD